MAQVSFNIPDGALTRVLNAVAVSRDYDRLKLDGETKAQFAKRMIVEEVKRWVFNGERIIEIAANNQSKETDIDGIGID